MVFRSKFHLRFWTLSLCLCPQTHRHGNPQIPPSRSEAFKRVKGLAEECDEVEEEEGGEKKKNRAQREH